MTIAEEISSLRGLKYYELCNYLQKKYGIPKGDYFVTTSCKTPNQKIKRSSEGLFIHHIKESEFPDLSKTEMGLRVSFEYQEGKNLVYCNYFEHLLLHIAIVREFLKNENPGIYPHPSRPGLILVGVGGLVNYIVPQIVDYINGYQYERAYLIRALKVVDGNESLFIQLVKDFEAELRDSDQFYKLRAAAFIKGEHHFSTFLQGKMTREGKVDDLIFEYEVNRDKIHLLPLQDLLSEVKKQVIDRLVIVIRSKTMKHQYCLDYLDFEKPQTLSLLLKDRDYSKTINDYLTSSMDIFRYSISRPLSVLIPKKSNVELEKDQTTDKYYFVINGIRFSKTKCSLTNANKIIRRYLRIVAC